MSEIEPSAQDGAPAVSQKSTASRAATGSSVFVALSVVRRAVPLLLLPAFSASLNPGEYGQIAFLIAVTGALGAILGLGLEPAVVRTFVQLSADPARRRVFVNTVGLFSLTVPLFGALAAAAAFTAVPTLRNVAPDPMIVLMAFVAAGVQTTGTVFTGALLRAQERLRAYAALEMLQGLGAPFLAVVLVVIMDLGVSGWFAATLAASAVSLIVGLILLGHRWTAELSRQVLTAALIFGIPLLPHALSHWTLNLSDRIVLAGYVGANDLGVYNLAYQLASPIGLILVALRQGLMPIYAAAHDDARLRHDIGHVSTVQVHLTGLLGLTVALLGPSALSLVFPASYRGGAEFIPWIALGYVLFGLYLVPVDSLSLMLGRTRWIWLPTVLAATTNLVLNILFVPALGAMAAAINTAVAYGVLLLGIVVLRRVEPGPRIQYDLPRMLAGLLVVLIAGAGAALLAPGWERGEDVVIRTSAVLAAALVILAYDRRWWRGMGTERRQPTGTVGPASGP